MNQLHEVAQRHVDAFNAHDAEAHAANEAATIEWVQPGGITLRGPEQVAENQRLLWEAFPDARMEVVARVAEGDTVATEAVLSGTHRGAFRTPQGDIPPTGSSIRLPFVTVQRVEDGAVRSEHLYFDLMELLSQIGAAPGR